MESQDLTLSDDGVAKMDLRSGASVNKDGIEDGDGTGMGWFPGYAINKESGERLNIMFAEDSWLKADNGDDMVGINSDYQLPPWANGSYPRW